MTKDPPALRRSHRRALMELAADGNGILTAAGARRLGISSSALAYHASTGMIQRRSRGVYRFAAFAHDDRESIVAAAAALGDDAVLSHESALRRYGVSDVAPARLSFTVPRKRRYKNAPTSDVELHTTSREFEVGEIVRHEGFLATSLARSIVDSARANTAPNQIATAVEEGLRKNLVTRHDLELAARRAPARVGRFIVKAMNDYYRG